MEVEFLMPPPPVSLAAEEAAAFEAEAFWRSLEDKSLVLRCLSENELKNSFELII